MTIINTKLGGTNPTDGDILTADNFTDTINATFKIGRTKVAINTGSQYFALVSSTTWLRQVDAGIIQKSTDSGANWSTVYTGGGTTSRGLAGDGTVFVAYWTGLGTAFSTDSGATWTASSTSPANVTNISDIQVIGSDVWVYGKASAGVDIWLSTDSGDNFAHATSGPSNVDGRGIMNADTNNGLFITNAGDVYLTINGGVDWNDEGFNARTPGGSSDQAFSMLSLSATTYLYCDTEITGTIIQYIDTAADTATNKVWLRGTYTEYFVTNFVELTNGTICISQKGKSGSNEFNTCTFLYSEDSGVSWYAKPIVLGMITQTHVTQELFEYDTNKLLYLAEYSLAYLDEVF